MRTLAGAFVILLLAVSAGLPATAKAQQASSSVSAGSTASSSSNDSFITAKTAQDQNIAAADQEDEEAAFKKSSAVRAVGRIFHLSPDHASILFEDFNFLLLAGVIVFYGIKFLPKFFRGRQQKIDQQLLEARVATEQANERLLAVEQRLSRLDQEIEQLRVRAEHEGAADEQRIKSSIEEERKKIVASAEHEINAISLAAERNLRKFAAELAVARASARIHLTEADDRTLIRDFKPQTDLQADMKARRN